jgi:hypothetical protein
MNISMSHLCHIENRTRGMGEMGLILTLTSGGGAVNFSTKIHRKDCVSHTQDRVTGLPQFLHVALCLSLINALILSTPFCSTYFCSMLYLTVMIISGFEKNIRF